ncbi:MAG: GNAT family N-acetyltransferase [Bradyrhizobiaceae bacterium]|nr:GNAT family N-acetyltransferase [Bradyrhizobiaceae bacterium]
MLSAELDAELGAGVEFWGHEQGGALVGVIGFQPVLDVDLIRHACVLPLHQRRGIGATLLKHLRRLSARQMLVGAGRRRTGD